MNKVLIIASVASMIEQFNMPNIQLLQDMGYTVEVACNFKKGNTCSDEKIAELKKELDKRGVRYYQIDFARDIIKISMNVKAFCQVKKLLSETPYAFLHCHSPIGGVVGRIAGKLKNTKVIYTAHGFHFYRGAPLKNWLIYYPVEKICSYLTDVLITINEEDYHLALKKMKAKRVEYIPGIGIDLNKFTAVSTKKDNLRHILSIPEEHEWLFSVGELIPRKNQEPLIRAVAEISGTYLTIAGQGELKDYLTNLIQELGVSDRIKLLGFRSDIPELCAACDIFVFPSLQEGLPVAMMEAMASKKPVVCSRIRGNVDLLEEGRGGYFFELGSVKSIVTAIQKMMSSDKETMGAFNQKKIKLYSISEIEKRNRDIYSKI